MRNRFDEGYRGGEDMRDRERGMRGREWFDRDESNDLRGRNDWREGYYGSERDRGDMRRGEWGNDYGRYGRGIGDRDMDTGFSMRDMDRYAGRGHGWDRDRDRDWDVRRSLGDEGWSSRSGGLSTMRDEEDLQGRQMGGMRRWDERGRGLGSSMRGGSRDFYGQSYGQSGMMNRGISEQYGSMQGQRPSMRGKGPKGWKRSDERIREDLCERIVDNGIDASDVEIQVEEGEVTLVGNVHQRVYKHRIEDLADQVTGVKDVHNQIRVKPIDEQTAERASESMSGTVMPSTAHDGNRRPQTTHR